MSFWTSLTGQDAADASRAAAADQYGKQTKAAEDLRNAGNTYQSNISGVAQAYNPYVQGGGAAQSQVYNLMGLNGSGQQGAAFDQFRTDPGYQFQMNQGLGAIDRGAAARSGVQNGTTLKAEQKYGANLADQSYGSYLQRLMGLGQQGLGATQAQAGLQAQGYQGQLGANTGAANLMFGGAGTIGQGDIAAANAQASGSQNLLNTGLKLGGMALGALGGPAVGSSFGGGQGIGSMMNAGSSFGDALGTAAQGGGYYGGSPASNPFLKPYG